MPGNSRLFRKVKGDQVDASRGLLPVEDIRPDRRVYGTGGYGTPVKGRVAMPEGIFSQLLPRTPVSLPEANTHIIEPMDEDEDEEEDEDELMEYDEIEAKQKEEFRQKKVQKKQRQWEKWTNDVIPNMVPSYLGLMAETDSLRNIQDARMHFDCLGCDNVRQIAVTCVFFDKIEVVNMCTCSSVALQLLRRGFFPCAPLFPTLAVDITMLDFAREHFVNAAPNTSAWCETLEAFLGSRRYKLETRNSLRQRFSNTLQWYTTLLNQKNLLVGDYLSKVRQTLRASQVANNEVQDRGSHTKDSSLDMNEELSEPAEHQPDSDEPDIDQTQNPSTNMKEELTQPTEYLRERCPLCFGAKGWSKPTELVDAIVCIDACFTQKRRKSQGNMWNFPREHPETIFVSPEEEKRMEALVDELRPPRARNAPAPPESEYDPGLRVPNAVLNECNESFTAADSNRIKASTQFFADTGLMALLCRHDRPLFLVNMTSAGERQHYALCLLDKLFQHIPQTMRIGVLYDIGCQLHRSCSNYDFLPNILDRLVFGISVFHAYGHQWPCQVIYHPRKCRGFGLTDGEGCERFWSALKLLIPSLRVSGYFNRIYTIDTHVKHLDEKSLFGLGQWLKRKWAVAVERGQGATVILADVEGQGYTQEYLRSQWELQIVEQTKPLKKQSPNIAKKEIHEILALMDGIQSKREELRDLNRMIELGEYTEGLSAVEVEAMIQDLEQSLDQTVKIVAKRRSKLSVDGRLSLKRLVDNVYLKKRLNALALKQRIQARLRNRKFELTNLERAYRKTLNHMKLDKNAESQIKRKEPGIRALVTKYNKLCDELQVIIHKKQAPKGAVAPLKIAMENVFKLDVDDNIWQDIGLTDDCDDMDEIPDWLGNDEVRKGIKALLEHERCEEEKRRIIAERADMQEWILEEWTVVQKALEWTQEDAGVFYELQKKKQRLLRLCLLWEPAVRHISCYLGENWGPTYLELHEARKFEWNIQADGTQEDEEEYVDDMISGEDIEAAALFDDFEEMAMGDNFRFYEM